MNGWKSYLGVFLMAVLTSAFDVGWFPEFWFNLAMPMAQGLTGVGLIHKGVKAMKGKQDG